MDFTVFFVFAVFSPSTFSFAWFFFWSFIMMIVYFLRGVCVCVLSAPTLFHICFCFCPKPALRWMCFFYLPSFRSMLFCGFMCKCASSEWNLSWKQTAGENYWKKSRSRSSSKSKLTQTAVAHTSKTNNSERLSKPFSLREIVVKQWNQIKGQKETIGWNKNFAYITFFSLVMQLFAMRFVLSKGCFLFPNQMGVRNWFA